MDDLGLTVRPADGTPMSNGTASPVTTVLRDMLWNPIGGADSSDHDHIRGDREERSQHRSRRNIFSRDREITPTTPDSRHSFGNEADGTTNELSTDSPGDQVAMDFGMNVPHPDSDDE